MIAALLLLVSLLPHESIVTQQCDMVEVNHVYSDTGDLRLSQVIWLDWSRDFDRYDVVDWRMLADVGLPIMSSRKYVCDWFDKKCKRHLRVVALVYRETWTIVDPELAAREVWPENRRRLIHGKATK